MGTRTLYWVVVITALFSVVYADTQRSTLLQKRSRISSLADIVPGLKPPVIVSKFGAADEREEIEKIKEVLRKEPPAATPAKSDPDNDDSWPEDVDDGDGSSAPGSHNAGGSSSSSTSSSEGSSKGKEKKNDDEDDKNTAINAEIKLLERLIAEGKKIMAALPEKEARLAALKKKLLEAASEDARSDAEGKLAEEESLLRQLNQKIEKLKKKLAELEQSKQALEADIAKNKAIASGQAPPPAAK